MSHRFLPHRRLPLCAAVSLSAFLMGPGMVSAQAQRQSPQIVGGSGQGSTQKIPSGSLTQSLQSPALRWDAREKGVLLWVDINPEAEPSRLQQNLQLRTNGFVATSQAAPLQPDANGAMRLPDVAAYFDRRIARAGSLTVLAPTQTTVLATRLPAPDIYADLSLTDKLRRLQATLSPEQWRLVGSSQGLGIGDLKGPQRAIFASLLPDPLLLTRTVSKNGYDTQTGNPSPLNLSPAQKKNVRLTLYRTLSWSYTTIDPKRGGSIGIGTGAATDAEGVETVSLFQPFSSMFGAEGTLFGAAVKSVVPDRPKPSDIAYDSSALDKTVVPNDAKTVGDLINAVKEKTGAVLFCDIRTRDLPIHTVGNQAVRTGDALQAVALAVSGTFRKVQDGNTSAYVLTDDLEGLGTRQVRIAEWAQAASALRKAGEVAVSEAMAKVSAQTIGNYVQWRPGDPNAPSESLAAQIENFRTGKIAPTTIDNKPDTSDNAFWASVSDLPQTAQNAVAQAATSWKKSIEEAQQRGENVTNRLPLREDKVRVQVQTGLGFLVPGVGLVQTNRVQTGRPQELLAPVAPVRPPVSEGRTNPNGNAAPPAAPAPEPPFYLGIKETRALLVALPPNQDAAQKTVSAAKAHGFNQLWVELPTSQTDGANANKPLADTIAAAEAEGIRVQAVVRVLRRPSGSVANLPRDTNIVGETLTQWATRRTELLKNGSSTSLYDYEMRQRENFLREAKDEEKQGDYLDAASPVETAVFSQLQNLAQTEHLAGIVVRGISPPGSDNTRFSYWEASSLRPIAGDFGYTPARRLAFLQETGVDPIDLSPLSNGMLSMGGALPRASLILPQFPDYGTNGNSLYMNGTTGDKLGAKNSLAQWDAFRQKETNAFWNRLRQKGVVSFPGVPLLRLSGQTSTGSGSGQIAWAGAWDKIAPPAASDKNSPAPPQGYLKNLEQKARQTSGDPVLLFRYDPGAEKAYSNYDQNVAQAEEGQARQVQQTRFAQLLKYHLVGFENGWSGLVIDLTALPLDEALPLLQGVAAGTPPPAPPAPKKSDNP